ncbi:MAG: HAD family hydrolase [Candidatus Azotimanducaceae bacterium WSBS_2022_MAG_OTU7]
MNPAPARAALLAMITGELGVKQSQVLAIGDGINDVSMLSWAGHGGTPEHGDAFAKDSAKEVLAGDGVSGVVARLLAIV